MTASQSCTKPPVAIATRATSLQGITEMTTTIRTTLLTATLLLAAQVCTRAESPGGIGVLGDSYSDEYEFYPPDRTTARNWVEILAATRGLDFGRFGDESRGEPRNRGFAYN